MSYSQMAAGVESDWRRMSSGLGIVVLTCCVAATLTVPYLVLGYAIYKAVQDRCYHTAAGIVTVKMLLRWFWLPAGSNWIEHNAAFIFSVFGQAGQPWQASAILVSKKYLLHVILIILCCTELGFPAEIAVGAYCALAIMQRYAASLFRPPRQRDEVLPRGKRRSQSGKSRSPSKAPAKSLRIVMYSDSFFPKVCL